MKRFWTKRRTRFLVVAAAVVVCLAVGTSIGGAAIGGFVAAAPAKLASGARDVFAHSSTSAQEQQYPKGKTTICHHTGSQSNPYVMITVSNRALAAHARHGDIIPAPAGGCPTAATEPAAQAIQRTQSAQKAPNANKAKKIKKVKRSNGAQRGLNVRRAENARRSENVKKGKKSKKTQPQARRGQQNQNGNRGGNGNGRGVNGDRGENNRGGKKK